MCSSDLGHYNGKIDSPKIYGRVLTAPELAALKAGKAPADAVAAWDFSQNMASSRIVRNVDSLTSITVVMLGAAVAHVLILAFSDSHLPTDGKGWLAALGAAVFSTVIAMGFFFAGVKIVGPGEAAVLSTIEPVVSIVVGVTALHESLGVVRVLGALMVLVSVAVLARASRPADVADRQRYAEK